jgi:hypothetical protein
VTIEHAVPQSSKVNNTRRLQEAAWVINLFFISGYGLGRGAGVGRGRGVGVHLPVHGVGVGVGDGVGPDCAQYLPPVPVELLE